MQLLKVTQLAKSFPAASVFSQIQFDLSEGEILLVCGPNGSGKTTLLHVAVGRRRPTSGAVRCLAAEEAGQLSEAADAGSGESLVADDDQIGVPVPEAAQPAPRGKQRVERLPAIAERADPSIRSAGAVVSEMPPGYQRMHPGSGVLVAFSSRTPRSKSPSGIQQASPLQRAWMMRCV